MNTLFRLLPPTVVFAALYLALRNLPATDCAFLHYAEVYNPVTGETELCAVAPAEYVDLVAHPFPVRLEFENGPTTTGIDPAEWSFRLINPDGRPFAAHEIGITHTERVHCLLIDSTRQHYLHLHPTVQSDGSVFVLRVPPLPSGEWSLFTEFVPRLTRRVAMTRTTFEITAGPEAILPPESTAKPVLRLAGDRGETTFRAGRDHRLHLSVEAASAENGLQLEKVMDAYAHLVAFDPAVRGYVHMHPLIERVDSGDTAEMEFLFHPPKPGSYRVWVQVQDSGTAIFTPFDLIVTEG